MQNPPAGVKVVMEAVCIMKSVKPKKKDGDKPGQKIDDYWEPAKSKFLIYEKIEKFFLSKTGF